MSACLSGVSCGRDALIAEQQATIDVQRSKLLLMQRLVACDACFRPCGRLPRKSEEDRDARARKDAAAILASWLALASIRDWSRRSAAPTARSQVVPSGRPQRRGGHDRMQAKQQSAPSAAIRRQWQLPSTVPSPPSNWSSPRVRRGDWCHRQGSPLGRRRSTAGLMMIGSEPPPAPIPKRAAATGTTVTPSRSIGLP
jgi:hypothetical protein